MPAPLSSLSPVPTEAQGQLWLANEIGDGGHNSPQMSKRLRMGTMKRARARQFADIMPGIGKNEGDTISWMLLNRVETKGRRITELEEVPETRSSRQTASLVVTEWANSINTTRKLSDLSILPVERIIKRELEVDCADVLDDGAAERYRETPVKIGPADGDSLDRIAVNRNGVAPVVNNAGLTLEHVDEIGVEMRENDVPTFDHGDYYAMGRPRALAGVSKQLTKLHMYTESGLADIKNGEKGRYEGFRFIEQTNQARSDLFALNSYKSDEIFFFGEDPVTEGMVVPEEIQTAIPAGLGRRRQIGWFYLGEFGLTEPRAAHATVYHWTSLPGA